MTCGLCIPVPEEGLIVLASGSRILSGTLKFPDVSKIMNLPGDYTAISAGQMSVERKILKGFEELDEPGIAGFADIIADVCDEVDNAEFIIARDGEAWQIDADGVIYKLSKVQTIGTGADMAKGFLGACRKPKTVAQAKRLALKCLKFVSSQYVCEGPPFEAIEV